MEFYFLRAVSDEVSGSCCDLMIVPDMSRRYKERDLYSFGVCPVSFLNNRVKCCGSLYWLTVSILRNRGFIYSKLLIAPQKYLFPAKVEYKLEGNRNLGK